MTDHDRKIIITRKKALYCVKNDIHILFDKARCPTPKDYCKNRTACMIHRIEKGGDDI